MRLFKLALAVSVILILSAKNELRGQFVLGGDMRARLKWMEIEGETYKVIYPAGMDSLATRYLWLLEENKNAVMLGLGGITPVKMPAVLYNSTIRSNGMVVWAPKRMELFTLPAGNGYAQRWDEQLAIHESRHVGQMTHFTKGVYKLGSFLIGQQAPSLGVAIYPTRWMMEGDAVVAETELSNAGRGRSAEFLEYYRASFLEGETRNWSRWKLGSYRYYTPDFYTLGYLTNSTIRYKSGNYEYAGEIFDRLVKNFYTPFARDVSYIPLVGDVPRRFFRQGREMMTQYWKDELAKRGRHTNPQEILTEKGDGYREYLSPVVVGRDSVLYLRHSFNEPAVLVLASGGKEKVIRGVAANVKEIKWAWGKVWFVEQEVDPRWGNQVYGNLYLYDLKEKRMEKLVDGRFLGALQPDRDGEKIYVVEYFPDGVTAVSVVDADSGGIQETFYAPDSGEIKGCALVGDELYASVVTGKGLGIFRLERESGGWTCVLHEQSASIENLQGEGDLLYFLSDMDGVRNVYSYNPLGGELKRITNSLYGASEPYVHGDELYYSSLELMGRFPVKIALDSVVESGSAYTPWVEDGRLMGQYRYFVADTLSAQARRALAAKGMLATDEEIGERGGTSIVKYICTEEEFASKVEPRKYGKGGHLLRFHSWAPVYYDVEKIMESDYDNLHEVVSLGATMYSQNTLGTAVTMLGYSYRDGFNAAHFKMKYSGWYPRLQFSADINDGQRYGIWIERDGDMLKPQMKELSAPKVELSALVYLPLDFSSHGWNRAIVPQTGWQFDNTGVYDLLQQRYLYMNAFTSALQFYIMREMAHNGIFPKWGIGGVLKWRTAINGGINFGKEASVNIYGYLPGLVPSHGLKLSFSAQRQYADDKLYYFQNLVNMPRGYDDISGDKYLMGTFDYAFPVYLGDVNVMRTVYLKRMQVIPFADFAVMDSRNIHSYGTTVMVDFAPFTSMLDLSLGVRYSFNLKTAQVMLSTSLF